MKILKTTNYDIFKKQIGNRPIRKAHVARLTRSMNEDYLVTPIIVNENMLAVEALSIMNSKKVTCLCVHDKKNQKKTLGIITIHNILNANIQ